LTSKKKKKHNNLGVNFILLTTIITINLLGISYAHWDNQLDINTSISTGIMEPSFIRDYQLDNNGKGDLQIKFYKDSKSGKNIDTYNIMEISGEVYPGYEGELTYYIENKGTIPIKIKGEQIEPGGILPLKLEIYENVIEENEILCKQWNSE
jgi:hypothetical protein